MKRVYALIIVSMLFSSNAEARHGGVNDGSIVSHPSGCPGKAFCGCGASVRICGHPVRELFLARNWFKFPTASPAPGMAAVRSGHVWILESLVSGNIWIGYDANSGGHQTRIHARSLAGYRVVNPHCS